MLFNPTDKSNSIIAHIDFLLFGNSATMNTAYSLADRTRNVNVSYDEVVSLLFKADPNFKWDDTTNVNFPIAWLDLTANRDDYVMPDASLVINRVRIKDSGGNYKTLSAKNRAEFSDDQLNETGEPDGYFKIDNAVILVPKPNYGATDGVEIEFQRGGNHFTTTDTDTAPGFASIFHDYLSINAALLYALANNLTEKVSMLNGLKQKKEAQIVEHYQLRSPDQRPKLSLKKANIKNYRM